VSNNYETIIAIRGFASNKPVDTGIEWKIDFDTQTITFKPISFDQFKALRRYKVIAPDDIDERDMILGSFARDVDRIFEERDAIKSGV
jgi:hypothetical protein